MRDPGLAPPPARPGSIGDPAHQRIGQRVERACDGDRERDQPDRRQDHVAVELGHVDGDWDRHRRTGERRRAKEDLRGCTERSAECRPCRARASWAAADPRAGRTRISPAGCARRWRSARSRSTLAGFSVGSGGRFGLGDHRRGLARPGARRARRRGPLVRREARRRHAVGRPSSRRHRCSRARSPAHPISDTLDRPPGSHRLTEPCVPGSRTGCR